MKILLWVGPTFHCVHTPHARNCYVISCDMDAVERMFTNRSAEQIETLRAALHGDKLVPAGEGARGCLFGRTRRRQR
jgi:hypothetical protein